MTKIALITGSAGFVGRHMRAYLTERGYTVVAVDLRDGIDAVDWFSERGNVVTYDLVVHAAAHAPYRAAIDSDRRAFPYNVMLDAAMFEWAIRTRQRHVVYLSSSAIYPVGLQGEHGWRTTADRGFIGDRRLFEAQDDGEPFDDYGRTKLIGERMAIAARDADVNVTVVRPFSGYGEDQSERFPFGAFVARALRGENPFTIWGSADQVRDFIHIDDVCAGITAIVNAEAGGPVNLCTGRGTTMLELARLVCREAGYVPAFQVDKRAPLGVHYRVGDPTLMNRFHTAKITLEEGIRRAFQLR